MKPEMVRDHAVLRFAERVMGLDPEVIRKHIAEQLPDQKLLNGKYPITYGEHEMQVTIRDGHAVTIWKEGDPQAGK